MKKSMIPGWLVLTLAITTSTYAQEQERNIARKFDSVLLRLGRIKVTDSRQVQQVAAAESGPGVTGSGFSVLMGSLQQGIRDIALKRAGYHAGHGKSTGQQIDKDLLPLLSELPEPINGLPQARQEIRQNTDDNIYTRYIERVKAYRAGLEEQAKQKLAINQKDARQIQQEARQNAKKTQDALASNPLIQQMGGMDKIMSMTPEQREAMAKQISEKVKQNPQAYMVAHEPPTKATHEAAVAEREKASARMAIDQRQNDILAHAMEMSRVTSRLYQETEEYFNTLNKKINQEYASRVAALPVEEMGEAGHGKNTYPVDLAYQLILYPTEKSHALAAKEAWRSTLDAMKTTIAEYNDLLSDYSGEAMTRQLLEEKGLTPIQIAGGLCGDLIRLAQEAKQLTSQNASWQRTFEEKILHVYE